MAIFSSYVQLPEGMRKRSKERFRNPCPLDIPYEIIWNGEKKAHCHTICFDVVCYWLSLKHFNAIVTGPKLRSWGSCGASHAKWKLLLGLLHSCYLQQDCQSIGVALCLVVNHLLHWKVVNQKPQSLPCWRHDMNLGAFIWQLNQLWSRRLINHTPQAIELSSIFYSTFIHFLPPRKWLSLQAL